MGARVGRRRAPELFRVRGARPSRARARRVAGRHSREPGLRELREPLRQCRPANQLLQPGPGLGFARRRRLRAGQRRRCGGGLLDRTVAEPSVILPVALTIAGSDSGGGAGIQADLKTFAVLGVHGTSALTAITAQNTRGVTDILELPASLVREQIDAVVEDMGVDAAKTGMLSSAAIIEVVADAIARHGLGKLVVDPVMVAKGGAKLLRDDAVAALRARLVPLAAVLTPNLPEAGVLLGRKVASVAERAQAARDLVAMGARAAVVKGGHADGDVTDVFFDGSRLVELEAERIATSNTHGSGCVFSAAITAAMARGAEPLEAVREAKSFVTRAIARSLEIGHGHGPVNPMFDR
ncbi:MAG: bifunctional hydroxymethylpyrimidine kinase/phosphomethylpyrimidine kinase [Chloroflexi bacterium]|nr:MAG: bifunctional hydroxymethylpyrimidine kinase/phosphomethylpyrimidine kinase [Chloroflexota bacterium]